MDLNILSCFAYCKDLCWQHRPHVLCYCRTCGSVAVVIRLCSVELRGSAGHCQGFLPPGHFPHNGSSDSVYCIMFAFLSSCVGGAEIIFGVTHPQWRFGFRRFTKKYVYAKFCIISALKLYVCTVEGFCPGTSLFTVIPQMLKEFEDLWSLEYPKRTPEVSDVLPRDAILGRAKGVFSMSLFSQWVFCGEDY